MGDTDLGTFSLFGTFRVPLGYSTPRYWIDTWVASADEVTTYSVSGASSSGALLQCSTKYCEVRISIGSLTEPPILRLGPNVEAAVTSISANNANLPRTQSFWQRRRRKLARRCSRSAFRLAHLAHSELASQA